MLDFVFVVLVYRNTKDLNDFFANLQLPRSKVIVVNSYYDEYTETTFRNIAEQNDAAFISVPNKGYGAGNNAGIEYALKHFQSKFLIISNADVVIKKLTVENVIAGKINAPKIVTKTGKGQNPYVPYHSNTLDTLKYRSFKTNRINLLKCCIAANKIARFVFLGLNFLTGINKTYSAHGCFIIIPYEALHKLVPIYNEKQFLFGEEDHFAMKCRRAGITMAYNPRIYILHKEDGSVSLESNLKQREIQKQSYLTFYECWYKKSQL